MRKELDIDMILSNLRVKPDAAAKQAARERMLAHGSGRGGVAAGGIRELSDDELGQVSAAGPGDRPNPQNKGGKHDLYDTQDLPDN